MNRIKLLAVASEVSLVLGILFIFWSTFSIPLNQMFPQQIDWPKFWIGLVLAALSAVGFLILLLSIRGFIPPSETERSVPP